MIKAIIFQGPLSHPPIWGHVLQDSLQVQGQTRNLNLDSQEMFHKKSRTTVEMLTFSTPQGNSNHEVYSGKLQQFWSCKLR